MDRGDCRHAFHRDGSLRDIYVQNLTIEHWEKFLDFVQSSGYGFTYSLDGETAPLPSNAAELLRDNCRPQFLAIDLGGVMVHAVAFVEYELELDIDPRQVTSPAAEDSVLDFMGRLGEALARDVILTEEASPEYVWYRYSSKDGVVRCDRTF